jgi:predicted negative regulator of RcsB-dependent stress response
MFRKSTIIKGLILLLIIGILASLGWAGWQIAKKKIKDETKPRETIQSTSTPERFQLKVEKEDPWGKKKY